MSHQKNRNRQAINKIRGANKYFCAIGRFIFEFSQLEFGLRAYVAKAIGLKNEFFYVTMTHDISLLCDVARTVLTKKMDAEQKVDFEPLISRIKSLNDERVRIAHGLWFVNDKEGKLLRASRGKQEAKVYFKKADELASLADRAKELQDELRLHCHFVLERKPR